MLGGEEKDPPQPFIIFCGATDLATTETKNEGVEPVA